MVWWNAKFQGKMYSFYSININRIGTHNRCGLVLVRIIIYWRKFVYPIQQIRFGVKVVKSVPFDAWIDVSLSTPTLRAEIIQMKATLDWFWNLRPVTDLTPFGLLGTGLESCCSPTYDSIMPARAWHRMFSFIIH